MTVPEERSVLVDAEDGVATVTLNRPARLNAFDVEMAERLTRALEDAAADAKVRAVVLRGAGRIFSAGGDVRAMLEALGSGDRAAYFDQPLAAFHRAALALRSVPKPVLASVHGAVAGVAFNLVLHSDLRIAAEGTRFAQAFVRLGLSPDGGGTWTLPRLVGPARAAELTMLPTELDARTARDWGLVNWVVPAAELEAETARRARELADGPTLALGRMKRLLAAAAAAPLGEQLDAERRAQVDNAASADFEEGVTAFLEKRPPRFRGR
jgi:2-(1,2-epoxy-1,2-dihydrophenyl)acetyl-CoA isomerase